MEFCLRIEGTVRPRLDGTVNEDMPTGAVEVVATSLEVLSPSATLPFQLDERTDVDEVKFKESMKAFEDATGITVNYIGDKEFESRISVSVDAGNPPDIEACGRDGHQVGKKK